MFHLLTALFFLAVLAGVGMLLVVLVRDDAERIVAALLRDRMPPVTARKAWPARVRLVSAPRPSGFRPRPLRVAVA